MFRRPEHARYRDAFPALARRAWALRTPARALDARSKSSSDLTRCLGAFDLLMLGVGGVIGGGVFVLTGAAAHDHAGPAVVVSYVLASLTSMVTALCYVEFAVECPVAGSAYNFVAQAFGEFAGYVAGCNLGLELTISAAAVARGWTSYVCTLFRADPDALRVRLGGILLDVPAALLVAAVTVMLARGMRNTARFNAAVTVVSLLVIGFVIVFGFAEVEPRNWSPFAPNGLPGVFSGAGVVFFSFVGFDTVATCAEETKNPGRDLPVGIMGSLGICAGLYALMSLVITGMVPTPEIDVQAPFAAAFRDKGLGWAESVISLGAVAAITTALLSSLMGQPRVYMVMARDGLLPAWIARVHDRFGTPLNASAFTGVTTGALALLVDIETLAQLVSIGTLFVFGSVCAGLLARRHTPEDGTGRAPALWRLAALLVSCVCVSASYRAMTLERGARGEGAGAGGGRRETREHFRKTRNGPRTRRTRRRARAWRWRSSASSRRRRRFCLSRGTTPPSAGSRRRSCRTSRRSAFSRRRISSPAFPRRRGFGSSRTSSSRRRCTSRTASRASRGGGGRRRRRARRRTEAVKARS